MPEFMKVRGLYLPYDTLNIEGVQQGDLTLEDKLNIVLALNMGLSGNKMEPVRSTLTGAIYTMAGNTDVQPFYGAVTLANNASTIITVPLTLNGNQGKIGQLIASVTAQPVWFFPTYDGANFQQLPQTIISSITVASALSFNGAVQFKITNKSGGNSTIDYIGLIQGP